MLVTFSTSAYADITMFGDVALNMLKLMGHSATVPGALLADDIPAALQKLEAAIEADKRSTQAEQSAAEENGEVSVSLSHRAMPLIELLKAAVKANSNVMWDSGGS
jgi:hypothetical protein